MLAAVFHLNDPYFWAAAGLCLGVAEMFRPGVFLLWVGLAAMATSFILMLIALQNPAIILLLFAALSAISALIGKRVYGSRASHDGVELNQGAKSLIGARFVLDQPIQNGIGRIRVNDSVWLVHGADMAAGVAIRVVAVENGVRLKVEAA